MFYHTIEYTIQKSWVHKSTKHIMTDKQNTKTQRHTLSGYI